MWDLLQCPQIFLGHLLPLTFSIFWGCKCWNPAPPVQELYLNQTSSVGSLPIISGRKCRYFWVNSAPPSQSHASKEAAGNHLVPLLLEVVAPVEMAEEMKVLGLGGFPARPAMPTSASVSKLI